MLSLALAFIQDSSTPQQINPNTAAGIGIAAILFMVVICFAIAAFVIYCYWRIFTKAGMNGAMSLIMLIPGVGAIIMICILAFGDWKVVPISQAAPLPPAYPPPSYPPASFPPS
jgi:heme/copper-type cytochrome/quinol oxidase subunit 2